MTGFRRILFIVHTIEYVSLFIVMTSFIYAMLPKLSRNFLLSMHVLCLLQSQGYGRIQVWPTNIRTCTDIDTLILEVIFDLLSFSSRSRIMVNIIMDNFITYEINISVDATSVGTNLSYTVCFSRFSSFLPFPWFFCGYGSRFRHLYFSLLDLRKGRTSKNSSLTLAYFRSKR